MKQPMKTKLIHRLGPLLGLILFSIALWVLHQELKTYHFRDIVQYLRDLPAHQLLTALILTFLSYIVMTGYDILAIKYIQHPLEYTRIALASFIGYAFSNNVGLSMIAGASVRYRLYSGWGLSAFDITRVVAFCTLTLWLGFFTLGGLVFLLEPVAISKTIHLPFGSARLLGIILLLIVAAYFAGSVFRKQPIKIREWEFSLPSVRLFFAQTAIAIFDWALAASVLYALMPPVLSLSYPEFIAIYMLAQLAGLVSQVPGGIGVFETIVLVLLSPHLPASDILGALIAYRGVYYLFPLGLAAVLLGTEEFLRKKDKAHRFVSLFSRWVSGVSPHILSFFVFVGGAIMIISGATPATRFRLEWLKKLMPLPFLEISHFLGSLTGMALLLLARGLQRRLDAAYVLTTVLLGFGILTSLLKGLDYEEAIILLVILAVILPNHRYFYRKASLFSQRFNASWITAIAVVLIGSVWLGMFSYRHVEYSDSLWWRFAFSGNAPRFLRATVGAASIAILFAIARLLRPAPPKPVLSRQENLFKLSTIVQQSRQTYANLALLGDKRYLFNQKETAFIMYGIEGRSWVSMGDPVGPEEEWPDLLWRFREISDRYGGWTVFYEIGQESLHFYLDLGLTLIKLGEQARVPLTGFSIEGSARKNLRYTKRKLEKEGCLFEIIPPDNIPSVLPDLKTISDAWLKEKNTQEKGFSLGFFETEYLKRFPAGIVRKDEKIIAFANIWQGAEKDELSIDLMRYLPDASHDVMEYLFIQIMLWGKAEQYQWFNLGMAPLSGLDDRSLAPLWNRLGAFVFRHGEDFYNFQGLRRYKDKFDPVWQPKYIACPGGMILPRILANLAALISGGLKGIIAK
jgi:phosphatidylglycerol lysyltransferase